MSAEDLPVVLDVALSSAPWELLQPFALQLNRSNKRLDGEDLETNLKCSRNTALRTMKTLKILGLVDLSKESIYCRDGTNQIGYVMRLKSEFKWFRSDEFDQLWRQKVPYEPRPPAPPPIALESWEHMKFAPMPAAETRPAENKEAQS